MKRNVLALKVGMSHEWQSIYMHMVHSVAVLSVARKKFVALINSMY